MVLCLATLAALGSRLTLEGERSEIHLNGATLSAACASNAQAGVLWVSGYLDEASSPGGNATVGLAGIRSSCAGVESMSDPCAAHRPDVPPLFYCHWAGATGQFTTGPRQALPATGGTDGVDGVTLECPLPHALTEAAYNLTIYHMAVPPSSAARRLPFRGVAGGDVVRRYPADCAEVQQREPYTPTGAYLVRPSATIDPFEVYCDMDSIPGQAYAVVWRIGSAGCYNCAPGTNGGAQAYYTTSALGTSTVIDNRVSNSAFGSGVSKLSDAQIDAMVRVRPDSHQFIWYTRGEATAQIGSGTRARVGWATMKLHPGQQYSTTGYMRQSCRGRDDSEWDDWYTPTTDAGLTMRAHYFENSASYHRCYFDGRSCGGTGGCTANGADNGYFIMYACSSPPRPLSQPLLFLPARLMWSGVVGRGRAERNDRFASVQAAFIQLLRHLWAERRVRRKYQRRHSPGAFDAAADASTPPDGVSILPRHQAGNARISIWHVHHPAKLSVQV